MPAILMSQARASSTAPARTSDVRSATESRPGSFVWAYRGRIRTISSSLSGHASLDQLQEYLNEVDNDFLADAAMAKLTEIKKKNQSDQRAERHQSITRIGSNIKANFCRLMGPSGHAQVNDFNGLQNGGDQKSSLKPLSLLTRSYDHLLVARTRSLFVTAEPAGASTRWQAAWAGESIQQMGARGLEELPDLGRQKILVPLLAVQKSA